MNIDWSEAPEGTEAAHPGSAGFHQAWYRRDTAGMVEQICPEAGVKNWAWMGGRKDFPKGHVLRPERDCTAWTGEGRPPVGTVCEWCCNSNDGWQAIKILGYDGCDAWIQPIGLCSRIVGNLSNLRPIRTPEQIAAEKEVSDMIDDAMDGHMCLTEAEAKIVCAQLHKAGYRKQVSP